MKAKHTEGPWHYDDTWGLIMAGKNEVAACHAGRAGTREETQANARLIAAAPELLVALKEVMTSLEVHISEVCPDDIKLSEYCPCTENELARARAVIAKVTGEE